MQTGEECKEQGGSGGERERERVHGRERERERESGGLIMTYGLVLLLEFSGRMGGREERRERTPCHKEECLLSGERERETLHYQANDEKHFFHAIRSKHLPPLT
jgi:hypothetical protein